MSEKSKITFFKINSCGYYNAGPTPVRAFCSMGDLLSQLHIWSANKSLAQTQTFQTSENDNFLPVYLFDIHQSGTDWLLTFWNQTPATDNAVASVMANGDVGNATVHMNEIVPGSIPGFATYFWYLPSQDLIANVRFQHPVSGHAPMRSYLRGFLEKSSNHVVYSDEVDGASTADVEIVGYRQFENSPVLTSLYPRFMTSIFTKPGDQEMLLENASRITKVRRRTTLELQTGEDLEFWQDLWRRFKGTARSGHGDTVTVEYDIKTQVTREEVQETIDEWSSEDESPAWNDFGFQLKGDHQIHWLNRSYARDSFELEVTRENAEVVGGESLLQELTQKKLVILQLLD